MEEKFGKILEEIQKVAGELDSTWRNSSESYRSCGYRVVISKGRGTFGSYDAEVVIPVFSEALSKEGLKSGVSYISSMHVGEDQYTINGSSNGQSPEDALRKAFQNLLGKLEILSRGL